LKGIFCFYTIHKSISLSKKPLFMERKNVLSFVTLELALRTWTACFVIIYGAAKAFQFQGAALSETPINQAGRAELMWAFFGATSFYPIFIGVIQISGAFLLLFQRTKLLGALILFPIFMNIILMDYLYYIHRGALINALLYFSVCVMILVQQRQKLAQLLLPSHKITREEYIVKLILAGTFALVFVIMNLYLPNFILRKLG
jgi:hypothetical protein